MIREEDNAQESNIVNSTIYASLSEAQLGCIPSDDEIEVPAFVRQCLAHHDYVRVEADKRFFTHQHTYQHPSGCQIHIVTNDLELAWIHTMPASPQNANGLVNHLETLHSGKF